jgi:orotate phosphoribosyltransferase
LVFFSDSKSALVAHLKTHALRTDGPFTLRSGATSDWYLDARQTTFDGEGARLVGAAVAAVLPAGTTAVGGMTMGADPIAVATAMTCSPPLRSFSIRKVAKDHGTGGRIVGPVGPDDRAVVLEDTTTTGSALAEAITVLQDEGVPIIGALALVDRSGGAVAERMTGAGVAYDAIVTPSDLGVT